MRRTVSSSAAAALIGITFLATVSCHDPTKTKIRGTISRAFWSMSLQPSTSLVSQASGACLGVVLKQRPDDEFDIDLAMAKKSGLIPEAGSFDTRSLPGRDIELTFNPVSVGHVEGSPKGAAIYAVNSLKVISQAASH